MFTLFSTDIYETLGMESYRNDKYKEFNLFNIREKSKMITNQFLTETKPKIVYNPIFHDVREIEKKQLIDIKYYDDNKNIYTILAELV